MAKDNNSFYVVLGLLSLGAKSGYDIKKRIENQIGHYFKISNGQIYPILKNLTELGFATVTVQENDGKPDRKVYQITEKGAAAFRQWLARPVDYHNPGGNELLLKLYFGPQATAENNQKFLQTYLEMKRGVLAVYKQIDKDFHSFPALSLADQYSYLTLRYGQIMVQASIQWCQEAMDCIEKIKEKP